MNFISKIYAIKFHKKLTLHRFFVGFLKTMSDPDTCYICLGEETEDDKMIHENPCNCTGSIKIHWSCFSELWRDGTKLSCDICKSKFKFKSGYEIGEYTGQKNPVIVMDVTDRKIFSKNGSLLYEGTLINDKYHGPWRQYYNSGELHIEFIYVNGKKHGPEKRYYKSGMLQQEVSWINNKMHGSLKEYNEAGEQILETMYSLGRII